MAAHSLSIYIIFSFIILSFCSMISAVSEPPVDVLICLKGNDFTPNEDMADNYVGTALTDATVTALVSADGNVNSLLSDTTSISFNTSIGSNVYLVYTKGHIDTIDSKIQYIRSGEFEEMPNPSFGFPISKKKQISISLEYETIDLIGKETFGAGFHDLIIENYGVNGNQYILDIKRK